MAEKKVIQMETSLGMAEAVKDDQGTPWEINYPWGADRFYGSAGEVRARMKRQIEAYEKAEAEAP